MSIKMIHQHPLDAREMVEGHMVEPGEKLQKGDFYADSTTKKWEPVPDPFIGSFLNGNGRGKLVRPVE